MHLLILINRKPLRTQKHKQTKMCEPIRKNDQVILGLRKTMQDNGMQFRHVKATILHGSMSWSEVIPSTPWKVLPVCYLVGVSEKGSIRLEEKACFYDNHVILVTILDLRWHRCC